MGLFGALFTGVSGLDAQSQALGVISNNIANVSTVGYKGSTSAFADLVTQTNVAEQYDPGGVRASLTQSVTKQGELEQTSSSTDLAIGGDGMFVVTPNASDYALQEPLYTRAGSFNTDKNGNLVNTAGYYLMGWKLDSSGNLPAAADTTSSLTPINVNSISSVLQETKNLTVSLNVDSTDAGSGGTPGVYNSAVTPNFSHQVSVVDSLGTSQSLTLNMTKNYPDAWTATVTGGGAGGSYPYSFGVLFDTSGRIQASGAVVAGAPSTSTVATSSGTASDTFSSAISGNVMTVTEVNDNGTNSTATTTTTYTYGSGVQDPDTGPISVQLPAMNFGDGSDTTQTVKLDITNTTQYDSPDNVNSISNDGTVFGARTGISINAAGDVSASFSNGQVVNIYQIPIATFNSFNSLQEQSGDVYRQTSGSGPYVLRQASTGGAGGVVSSSLENSNVDIADEFSKMIITQQAYSANTKVITTADQMLSTLLQIQTG